MTWVILSQGVSWGLHNPCLHSHTKKHCACTTAVQNDPCMQFPWDLATDTTGSYSSVASTGSSLRYHFVFSQKGYVCVPDSALRKEGAGDVCGYSELPTVYWCFQPGQSCGLAALRNDWFCPWCHFYTDASAPSSTVAASHGPSQMEAQLEVKTPQLITPQACLEEDTKLKPGGKRRDTGGKLWYARMGEIKHLGLDRLK